MKGYFARFFFLVMPSLYRHLFDSSRSVPLRNSGLVEMRKFTFPFLWAVEFYCTVYMLHVRILLKDTDAEVLVERWRNPYSFVTTCDRTLLTMVLFILNHNVITEYVERAQDIKQIHVREGGNKQIRIR